MRPVLYVTFDGILQPLGYSQVARIVCGLSGRGVPYRLLSLERPKELAQADLVRRVRTRLADAGVEWTILPYDVSGSAKAAAKNVGGATSEVLRLAAQREIGLVHARAYHAGLVALAARRALGMRYLFDARSYWLDERIVDGRWFSRSSVRSTARAIERRLYRDAAGVVTLTDIQANDLRTGKFGPWTGAPVATIPTCADYEEFRFRDEQGPSPMASSDSHSAAATIGASRGVPLELRERLRNKRVIGLVGSLNRSYYPDESLDVVRRALAYGDDLHLLVLSAQEAEWQALVHRAGIDPSRVTVTMAPHEDMPAYTALMDFAVLLLVVNEAKRASVPTKLGELFAVGVRPVYFGCNAEVTDWVERAGSGHVLERLDEPEIERAARFIAEARYDRDVLARAREITREHFSLATGLDRYETMLREILAMT